MNNFIKALTLLMFAMPLFAADKDNVVKEKDGTLPYNAHEFDWEAESKAGQKLRGHGIEYCKGAAFAFAGRELDRLAKKKIIENGTEFSVTIVWKDQTIKRTIVATAEYPVELPRGPDKEREMPRGPIRDLKENRR